MVVSKLLPSNSTVWAYCIGKRGCVFGIVFDRRDEHRHQNNYITVPLGMSAPNLARLMGTV